MTTRFELFEDTAELRETLLTADWGEPVEIWGERYYTIEIDDEEYEKVIFEDGSVLITDDAALAAGDYAED